MDAAEPLANLLHEPGSLVLDRTFAGTLPAGEGMDGVDLEGCTLRACQWTGSNLQGASFAECVFVGCNMSGALLDEVTFRECEFIGTKAMGVDFSTAQVSSLAAVPMVWRDCGLDYATMARLDMAGWTFRGCSLRETHLVGSDLRRTAFIECDLTGAAIAECDLREARLIDCVGVAVDLRDNRVSGLHVSESMAADLLSPFGVITH